MTEISAALVDLGIGGARVHTEIFGAAPASTPGIAAAAARPPHAPAGPPGDGPGIAFARSGLTVRWSSGYGSLLELDQSILDGSLDGPELRLMGSHVAALEPLVSACGGGSRGGSQACPGSQ